MIRTVLATASVSAAVLALTATPASARPAEPTPQSPASVTEMSARALAQQTHISMESARARIAAQDGQAATAAALERKLGAKAAGSYIDQATGKLVVNVLGASAAGAVTGATARVVQHSTAQLRAAETAARSRLAGMVQTSYLDPITNRVVVTVPAAKVAQARAALAGSPVTVQEQKGQLSTQATVYGGQQIEFNGYVCSLGFNGTRAGQKVFLTAGHCGRGNVAFTRNGAPLGQTQHYSFPGNDYAYASLNADWTGAGAVDRYNGTAVPVTGYSNGPVGTSVCKSGRTTGWTCGVVQARNVTVNYGADGTVTGMTQTNACTEGGDSGGSWLAGSSAQGLTSGGASYNGLCGEKVGQPNRSYFQPVDEAIQAYGITLTTS